MKKRRFIKRLKPAKSGPAYRQLWRLVDGAVLDCFTNHPDYLTERGKNYDTARRSLTKRVVGAVLGYASQKAQGRSEQPSRASAADRGHRHTPLVP